MEPLKSKAKCKIIILVEMILSGLTLSLFTVFLIGIAFHLAQDSSFLDLLEDGSQQPMEEAITFALRIIVLTHLIVLVLVLVAGANVLCRACSLPSNVTDWERIDAGCRACKLFCRVELFRMILIVIAFMGELSLFNLSIILELIRNVFNVPIVFCWFFASELQKELESRREAVTNPNCLYTISRNPNCLYTISSPSSTECQQNQCQSHVQNQSILHQHYSVPECNSNNLIVFSNGPRHEEHHPQRPAHLGMFMNTTPVVAYFLSSSHAPR